MNGSEIVIDTNIALYLLTGDRTLAEMLQGKEVYVSSITQLELLGYPLITEREIEQVENFLSACRIIDLSDPIKDLTIRIKRSGDTKLPDAIIAACALFMRLPLITADRDFTKIDDLDLVLYEI